MRAFERTGLIVDSGALLGLGGEELGESREREEGLLRGWGALENRLAGDGDGYRRRRGRWREHWCIAGRAGGRRRWRMSRSRSSETNDLSLDGTCFPIPFGAHDRLIGVTLVSA